MSYGFGHTVKTDFNEATGNLKSIRWTNHLNQEDAPCDFPSTVTFSNSGTLDSAIWKRRGKGHRDGDLPAVIYFDDAGRPRWWKWYQYGQLHREGGKPAEIEYLDGSLKALSSIGFCRHGEDFRENGRESYFEFDSDGIAYNADGDVIAFDGFDKSWLPSPVPTLVMPQLFPLKPFAPKP